MNRVKGNMVMQSMLTRERMKHEQGENFVKRDGIHARRRGHTVTLTDMATGITANVTCSSSSIARDVLHRLKLRFAPTEPRYLGDIADLANHIGEFVARVLKTQGTDVSFERIVDTTTPEFEANVAADIERCERGERVEPRT